jgi:2',3'-cyclic-nucleotide 2'-phosphodiesterase/3'-nucleotidase
LKLDGQPVRDDQPFIVVTNNYRASGGGRFPNLGGGSIVISAPDANRDALIAYIRAAKNITRTQFGNDRNWHFAKTKTAGPVIFTSTANKLDIARASGLDDVSFVKDDGDGTATYAIDIAK